MHAPRACLLPSVSLLGTEGQTVPLLPSGGGSLVTKLCPTPATPWIEACQAPLSMGFSRQEYWSGLPFPSPGDLYRLSYEGSLPSGDLELNVGEGGTYTLVCITERGFPENLVLRP